MIVKGKKCWGVIPLAVYLILQFLVMVIEQVTDSQLRNIPQIILFCGDKLLGWEDYGNGGNDPLEYDQEPIRREFYDEFSHGMPPVKIKVGTRDEEGASSGRDYDWI